ncbi:MAG: UDP-N-acetylmuramate--alanine ligase [Hyphomicrobiaceae bacterium]|jgi:UDP-N-acetylmuramate--alanine ligase
MSLLARFQQAAASTAVDPASPEGATAPRSGRIHFVGIGGIGMSGIAEVLLTLGYEVSGSDLREGAATARLAELGAVIFVGHDAAHIDAAVEVVVVSSAVDETNPEVHAARSHHVPVIARAEMLAELMRVKCGVAVAGSHGKTTTTSLAAAVLGRGGLDPTVVIGGRLKSLGGSNARLGSSPLMVAEADESDGSFLLLRPTVAVVTNIDREHMTHYGTMEHLVEAYVSFANSVPFYGRIIACIDCDAVRGILPRLKKRHTTYGISADADIRAVNLEVHGVHSEFDLHVNGNAAGHVRLAMPGEHAVLNALAAIAAGLEFGMSVAACAEALEVFEGVERRFDIKGTVAGITVVDDYGHHPTEIRATLAAARRGFTGRIVALFQPHRYSRLEDLFSEFTRAFDDADEVVVTDVYAAGEAPIAGIDAGAFEQALARRHAGRVRYVAAAGLAADVAAKLDEGDLLVTLGAGDITRVGPEVLAALRER